jgi:deferrochelatase/peroxidase EfeB
MTRRDPVNARRAFLKGAAFGAAALPFAGEAAATPPPMLAHAVAATEPFYGRHQGGIVTATQRHTYFAAFDVTTTRRAEVIDLLRQWTQVAADTTQAPTSFDPHADAAALQHDSGAAVGLAPSRLTVTFGFGPGLFAKDSVDRFGIGHQRPDALVDLPRFAGDQPDLARTGGDLSVQVNADDPQLVEYVLRRMAIMADGVAAMRWVQTGFNGGFKLGETPRNQMGFKDGTMNVAARDPAALERFVWVGGEGPAWLRGGTYMVIRPIRIALDHWDRMKLAFQEETVGRHKASGAPLGKAHEFDELDMDRTDEDGNPVIAENAHVAMAAPERNDGAQILRRAFNYDNGIAHIAERWPPWRQVVTFDAGLLFQCYQRDPWTGFIKLFTKMAQIDMLNQFSTHVGSGLFACPPAALPGGYIGQPLFE